MLAYIDNTALTKVAEALGEEEALKLIEVLKNSSETTDDVIANKTGVRLNSVRKILYKLYDHSLVSLRRTRDPKTGWFIFHWKLQPDQLEGFILSQKRRVLEKLTLRLEYEKNHVKVHDIIHEKAGDHWVMKKSYFRKLRISPQWMHDCLLKVGFKIENIDIDNEMIKIIARHLKRL